MAEIKLSVFLKESESYFPLHTAFATNILKDLSQASAWAGELHQQVSMREGVFVP